ncbi:MAG: aldehyde dehydrogenase family protein [Acidimicrobiales bacterium]|nr:aldehyde dehydrogenase family protein [Acidimicrobiales bacterium]
MKSRRRIRPGSHIEGARRGSSFEGILSQVTEISGDLISLKAGQAIPFGGNRFATVSADLAADFVAGDHLVVVANSGALLRIPASVHQIAHDAVTSASAAFAKMGSVTDDAISTFFDAFARRLADESAFAAISAANNADVAAAQARGRSVTRLVLSPQMRADMISGLQMWRDTASTRNAVIEEIHHDGWSVQQRSAGLGVIGFVFEGRPNVFADACGVIRTGNTVVFRIGSDALGTAEAIVEHALDPALAQSGLPPGAASLVASPERSAGWALFSDDRLALAVARGSGAAVAQLGAIAQQTGTPVSLHGTGGAWIITGASCDPERLRTVVANSLDRKVCNTVNTVCVLDQHFDQFAPAVIAGLTDAAAERRANPKVHVVSGAENSVPSNWFTEMVPIARAEGNVHEPRAESIARDQLGREWEWEESPEITLVRVASVAEAVQLFNEQSPRFAASLISDDPAEQENFFASIDAPFVGDGFTRWVDGQYALDQPELGLSNWQFGRLFARGGVLSGASVFTVRMKVTQTDPAVRR